MTLDPRDYEHPTPQPAQITPDGPPSSPHAFAARWATRQLVKAKVERDRPLAELYAQLVAAHIDRYLASRRLP